MIVGLFLRNFKTYEKFNFIPFSEGKDEKLNLFIGNNGAGKSSVLEALDVFFNGREFILNDNARSRDASVTPVFLIKKDKLNLQLKPEILDFAETLSSLIWNESFTSLYGSNPSMEFFTELRENLKMNVNIDDYYFLLFGHELSQKDYSLISIESKVETKLQESEIDEVKFKKLLNTLAQITINQYNFIYIPVETSITDFLKLEAVGMQLRPTITPGEFFIFREGQRKFDCFNESIDNQNFKFQTGGKLK
jgi:AAA15 family ATPase/GTPase